MGLSQEEIDVASDANRFREPVALDVQWNHGVSRRTGVAEPPIQIHRLSESTYVLRQSKTLSYEAPFLYLIFGPELAVLWDTGATADPVTFPLRETVDELVATWLGEHPHDTYPLIVAHTHAHGDHIAADRQFADRPRTTVVGHEVEAVQAFFQIADWPMGNGTLDLGGRELTILPIPGHHRASLAVYDPWSGILLTGDTIYPGRLYVSDYSDFVRSIRRLQDFAEEHPISAVLGCHIEMTTTPNRDYPLGATYQPQEAPLAMLPAHIGQVLQASKKAGAPGIHRFGEFIIVNGQSTRVVLALMVRGLLWRIGHRLRG